MVDSQKNRRNPTAWAEVPITTQFTASLPDTQDRRDTAKTTLAKPSPSLKQGGSTGGCHHGLLHYAGD